MSDSLTRLAHKTHEEAVAKVRRASLPRRLAVFGVVALSTVFIAMSVTLLTRVDKLHEALSAAVVNTSTLREIEISALQLASSIASAAAPADRSTHLERVDDLEHKIDSFLRSDGLPGPTIRSVREAGARLGTLRPQLEASGSNTVRVDSAFEVVSALTNAREAFRKAATEVTVELGSAWSITNGMLLASCVIAAMMAVAFWFAIRQGDARRVLELEMDGAFERAPAGIVVCDDRGVVRRANAGFASLLGRDASRLIGESLGQCLATPQEDAPAAFYEAVRAGADSGHFELTVAVSDRVRALSCEMRPMPRVKGAERRWAIRADDITEQRQALATLAERTDLLNALLAASRDGMLLIGPSGRIVFANQSFADLVGVDAAMLTGLSARDLAARLGERSIDAPESFRRLFGERDEELRGSLLPFRTVVRSPGIRVLLLSAVPVFGQANRWLGRLAMMRDVTQEEKAKRAKDVFLGNVSHELRTPLTSISGFVEFLRSEKAGAVNERQREMVRIIEENVARLSSLVDDVLAVGELEEERSNWATVDLSALVNEIVSLDRGPAEQRNLLIQFDSAGDSRIEGDERRLRHLFSNLVSNAIKYTREGAVRVFVDATKPDYIVAEVIDTGIGIDEADRPRIFERFYRAPNPDTRAIRGTGLGLAIAKLVCDQHNGRIEVESIRGKGSTFRVLLPRTREMRIPGPAERLLPIEREHPLVLAIDDDVMSHRIIAAALRVCRIDVICAETASQGIRAAIDHRPDALLVDVELPDMNGYEVIAQLRRDHGLGDTPVVVISGREPPPSLATLGVAAYLQKPVRSERLREAMVRVLGESRTLVDLPFEDESGVI